jgi:hypothetical protein
MLPWKTVLDEVDEDDCPPSGGCANEPELDEVD